MVQSVPGAHWNSVVMPPARLLLTIAVVIKMVPRIMLVIARLVVTIRVIVILITALNLARPKWEFPTISGSFGGVAKEDDSI